MVSQTDAIHVPILGTMRSWQAVFMIVGIPGLLLAFLIFTLPEPLRRGRGGLDQSLSWRKAYGDLLKFIGSRKRFFFCHYTAFGFASAVVAGGGTWYPAHLGRTFGWSASEIGLSLGIALTVGAIVSQVVSGRAIDALFRRGVRDAHFRWYAGCLVLATPAGIIATTSGNAWVFVIGLGIFIALVSSLPTCAATALNLVTPNELRGTGIAFWAGTAGLVGAASGPMLIAMFAEQFYSGPAAIGFGLATLMAICLPLGALFLFLGFRAMREAVAESEHWAT